MVPLSVRSFAITVFTSLEAGWQAPAFGCEDEEPVYNTFPRDGKAVCAGGTRALWEPTWRKPLGHSSGSLERGTVLEEVSGSEISFSSLLSLSLQVSLKRSAGLEVKLPSLRASWHLAQRGRKAGALPPSPTSLTLKDSPKSSPSCFYRYRAALWTSGWGEGELHGCWRRVFKPDRACVFPV